MVATAIVTTKAVQVIVEVSDRVILNGGGVTRRGTVVVATTNFAPFHGRVCGDQHRADMLVTQHSTIYDGAVEDLFRSMAPAPTGVRSTSF